MKSLKQNKQPNGTLTNGKHAEGEDIEMGDAEEESESDGKGSEGENGDDDDSSKNLIADIIPSVLRITISPDGQWLATSDDQRHTHIFNLDSISVSL